MEKCEKRVGMMKGSNDGEKGQHSIEAKGVLVERSELWLLVHFKSMRVNLTFKKKVSLSPKNILFQLIVSKSDGLLFLWLFLSGVF